MAPANELFLPLAVILGLSAAFGYLARLLRLPLIVAYLLAGVALSLLRIFGLPTSEALTYLPEIGMAFVLFFIGMELDIKEIKHLGKPIIVAGLGQIIISALAGFLIASALGFSSIVSFYLGTGLAFSSTIVVVKLLLEKKDLSSLYGKLSLGILLLEDVVAVLLLMGMALGSSVSTLGIHTSLPMLLLLGKGLFLMFLAFCLSHYVLERVFGAVARSAELLFLSAVAWCFIFVATSLLLGFSVVIGAFLAGVALANSPFHYEIQGKVKPLRDFFVTLFFVYLGSQVIFTDLLSVLPLILIFIAYALIAKPLIFLLILGAFGFRKHTIFQTAINLSQVSEFSLIIMVVGWQLGIIPQEVLTAMALTGVISIIVSSIVTTSSRKIYPVVSPLVGSFERGVNPHKAEGRKGGVVMEDHVILIGAHRVGGKVVKFLRQERIPFFVLDFNPRVIQKLMDNNIHALYGDLGDPEILEFLSLEKAKLIISTADNIDDNLLLLSELRRRRAKAVVIVRASSVSDAELLYTAKADYVLLPEIVSGDFVASVLQNHWPNMNYFRDREDIELNKLSRNHLVFE